jgi:hypothetical protein
MGDASDEDVVEDRRDDAATESTAAAAGDGTERPPAREEATELSTEELRREVEEKYDFENFSPDQMAEMSADEWDAAFDPDTWITGDELLDRVEADLKRRVLDRDVFARIERIDGQVLAYSDEGYAAVAPDGSVEGRGTVLRDVKPSVALCSMDSYEAPEMPDGELLPEPQEVPEGSGELGNLMLQVIGGFQLLAGVGLIGAWLLTDLNIIGLIGGLGFLTIGFILFVVVANARLSDRFRAEEYRNRLRAIGLESGERPDFVPIENGRYVGEQGTTAERGTRAPVESGASDDGEGENESATAGATAESTVGDEGAAEESTAAAEGERGDGSDER